MEKLLAQKFYEDEVNSLAIIARSMYLHSNDELAAVEDWLWFYCFKIVGGDTDNRGLAKILFDGIKCQIDLEALNGAIKKYQDDTPF